MAAPAFRSRELGRIMVERLHRDPSATEPDVAIAERVMTEAITDDPAGSEDVPYLVSEFERALRGSLDDIDFVEDDENNDGEGQR